VLSLAAGIADFSLPGSRSFPRRPVTYPAQGGDSQFFNRSCSSFLHFIKCGKNCMKLPATALA